MPPKKLTPKTKRVKKGSRASSDDEPMRSPFGSIRNLVSASSQESIIEEGSEDVVKAIDRGTKKKPKETILHPADSFAARTARTMKLNEKYIDKITTRLQRVLDAYEGGYDCICKGGAIKNSKTPKTTTRRSTSKAGPIENSKASKSTTRRSTSKGGTIENSKASKTTTRRSTMTNRCQGECDDGDCKGALCVQNAKAYIAAADYMKKHKCYENKAMPKLNKPVTNYVCHKRKFLKCASSEANHRVDYYDSGLFGDAICPICGAKWLPNHVKKFQNHKTHCCSNGEVLTDEMKRNYKELQNPPKEFLELVYAKDEKKREAFLSNTKALNNSFAFASTTSMKAPIEQCGGRHDCCKYNGEFSYSFSDLFAPAGMNPAFAQVYTLSPEAALNIRQENLSDAIAKKVGADILKILEQMIRVNHPYADTFTTAGQKYEEAMKEKGEVPNFQIVLLSNRTITDDAILNSDGATVIRRVEAPTAKQVAVIWISDDGIAPDVQGFFLSDKAGHMHKIWHGKPQLDPACFPLLRPRGTPGWTYRMEKYDIRKGNMIGVDQEMQAKLAAAQMNEIADPVADDLDMDADFLIHRADEEDEPDGELAMDADDGDEEEDATKDDQIKAIPKKHVNITGRQFARYEMSWREGCMGCFHWLWFGRRLAEFFVISICNRIERSEMDYVCKVQREHKMRKVIAKEFMAAIEAGLHREKGVEAKIGQVYLMPKTFAGSRQFYQEKYADLMTIVRRLGNPTWFITFTGNPRWPEIEACLQKGQSYEQRADIVSEIFMDKATEFIRDVCKKNVMGETAAWCYSVEHQKRGMPHIHMLLILKKDARIVLPADVDQYVSARIPYLPPMDDESVEAKQQRRLWHLVTSTMMHDCNAACKGTSLSDPCSKYFPKAFSKETVLSADRYAQYTRLEPLDEKDDFLPATDPEHQEEITYRRLRPAKNQEKLKNYDKQGLTHIKYKNRGNAAPVGFELNDSRVISYNPYLLLKFGCHINVEYVFGQKACKYIFKYLLKGFEKAYIKVLRSAEGKNVDPNLYDYDEMSATLAVRYMTAMEAYMRIHSYPIVNISHQIYALSIHEENGQSIVIEEGHAERAIDKVNQNTRLTGFFELCKTDPTARKYRYDEIPYYYSWNQRERKWKIRKKQKETDPEKTNLFVRIYSASPSRKELFAIRVLLMNRSGPTSFEDLRTVNGHTYSTFVEAANEMGLLENDGIYFAAMDDACHQISSRLQLHRYFAMLIYHSKPQNPQALFDHFLDQLYTPTTLANPEQQQVTKQFRIETVMKNLDYFFRTYGKTCSDMGLTGLPRDYDPDEYATQMDADMLQDEFYGDAVNKNQRSSPQQFVIRQLEKLNDDQKAAFNTISAALANRGDQPPLFFLEGAGGCGKTFLYNTIIRWALAGKPTKEADPSIALDKTPVIAAATTGIAALLLLGASTVHSQFFVPNEIDGDTQCKVNHESKGAERFRKTEIIIIDEVSMMDRLILNYLDKMMKELCSNDKPFGGKCIILGGDWRQLAPVVEGEGREGQVRASIKTDPLYGSFKTLKLEQNMRTAREQKQLRDWLLDVGRGYENGKPSEKLHVPRDLKANNLKEVIEFCFPPELFTDPLANSKAICGAAMLCPRNDDVQRTNDITIERMCGGITTATSLDTHLDDEVNLDQFRSDANLEALHNENPSGFPPHILNLKVGAPVILLRNLDVRNGLCNGTRLQITKITPDDAAPQNLTCKILTGPRASETVVLPRVKFEYGREKKQRGIKFIRLQFPIKLCFAMTINKAQGQTLQKMGLVLDYSNCFAHGQCYVALSRVTEMNSIRILAPVNSTGQAVIRNVVYQELMSSTPIILASERQHRKVLLWAILYSAIGKSNKHVHELIIPALISQVRSLEDMHLFWMGFCNAMPNQSVDFIKSHIAIRTYIRSRRAQFNPAELDNTANVTWADFQWSSEEFNPTNRGVNHENNGDSIVGEHLTQTLAELKSGSYGVPLLQKLTQLRECLKRYGLAMTDNNIPIVGELLYTIAYGRNDNSIHRAIIPSVMFQIPNQGILDQILEAFTNFAKNDYDTAYAAIRPYVLALQAYFNYM